MAANSGTTSTGRKNYYSVSPAISTVSPGA